MDPLKKMKRTRRIGLLVGVFLAATAILGGTALATTAVLNGGTIAVTTPSVDDFASVTLNGAAQSTTAGMGTFDVTDARGTGVGWNVTVQADQFDSGTHTLPMDSISMPAPSVGKIAATSGSVPSIISGPYHIDNASAVKIASAAGDGTGMGSYRFTPDVLTLSVPANAYAGTYTSTVTVSVNSGP
jgi:WxL domain surface cell wall-binding